MVFIEFSAFTRRLLELMSDDEYARMQNAMMERPDAGDLIPGTGGVRKLRWGLEGRGKRGGVRVIYYWVTPKDQIYLLLLYTKNEQGDLTPTQKKALREVIEQIK